MSKTCRVAVYSMNYIVLDNLYSLLIIPCTPDMTFQKRVWANSFFRLEKTLPRYCAGARIPEYCKF